MFPFGLSHCPEPHKQVNNMDIGVL